jgi:hypothetical protein
VTSRALRRTAALAVVLLLTACSGSDDPAGTSSPEGSPSASASSAECDEVVDGVLDATQRYVDQYGTAVAGGRPSGEVPDLEQVLQDARARMDALGCDEARTSERLSTGLDDLEASGPLAQAVKGQLVASMTGRVSPEVETREVGTRQDLRTVLPELAPGSTVRLAAGEHRLRDSVVLLQGVRLVGAGRGRTTLTSSAPDAALLALTQDRVDLRGLTLRHVGDEPASLVVGGASTSLVLDDVLVAGGSNGAGGGGRAAATRAPARGGSGVLMAAGRSAGGKRTTTLQVTDSVFRSNEAAGILLSGGHVASVVRSDFLDSGQCGICFVGTSSGLVRRARLQGGVAGLIAADGAAPLLVDSSVSSAQIGVQAVDRASPIIRRTTVTGASRGALLFGDRTRGRVESVTCPGSRFGIVVAPRAVPFVGENRCPVQPMG